MRSRSCPAGTAETVLPASLPGPERRLGACTVAGGAVLVVLGLVLGLGSGSVDRTTTDLMTPVAAAVAALECWRAAARQHARLRAFWVALCMACVLWTLAEVTWAWYELVLDGLAVAVALTLLTWSFALGPMWADNDLATTGGLVAVAYPFTDVVLVFLVVRTIVRSDGRDRVPLWFVLSGLLAMSLADSVYSYIATAGQFESGGLLDVGWVAGYVGIALGAYAAAHDDEQVTSRPDAETDSLAASVAPYVPVLIALLVMPAQLSSGDGLAGPVWVLALVLVLLVLVRQSLVAVDRQREHEAVSA